MRLQTNAIFESNKIGLGLCSPATVTCEPELNDAFENFSTISLLINNLILLNYGTK